MKYKKYKIIWVDPTGDTGWHTTDELDEFECEECVIEAYVYSKDKEYIKTFASYSINQETGVMTYGDVNVLPMSCVKTIKAIR